MKTILVKHIIEESKFSINFDLQDGSISFPTLDLDIKGDVDFKELIIKLLEFIENKREIQIEFEDQKNLQEGNTKITLIKETLSEIYNKYNSQIREEVDSDSVVYDSSMEPNQIYNDTDLPF